MGRSVAMRLCLCALAAACGGSADSADGGPPDADPLCWPVEGSSPGGEVEIGTGLGDFEPLGDTMDFVIGNQGGTFLILHSRMKSMSPGNADDPFDPINPRTKFQAVLEDDSVVGTACATTMGYEEAADGWHQRATKYILEFLPWEIGEAAFDTNLTLIVEVVDADGNYARAEKTVFCAAPPDL